MASDTEKDTRFLKALVAAAAAAGVIGLGVGLAYVDFTSTNPLVCVSCHKDEARLWEASQTHPPEHSSCASCHESEEGIRMTGRYAATPDSISANCLSCHEDRKEATETKGHLIKLSHKIHVTQEKLRCTDCHWNIAHDRYRSPTYRPTKHSCYVCHEHKREIDGKVTKKNCLRCHWQIPDVPEDSDDGGEAQEE
jgi:hypothetical protein